MSNNTFHTAGVARPDCRGLLWAPALAALLVVLLVVVACAPRRDLGDSPGEEPVPVPSGPVFEEAEGAAGIDFVHFNGMSGELYLAEITCGSGALIDFDQDGDLDVYLLQGRMLGPGKTLADALAPPAPGTPPGDRLYRNDGPPEGSGPRAFVDVSASLAVSMDRYGCGVAVGDADGDGLPDLYVANLGANQMLRNRGGGVFEDVGAAAGVDDPGSGVAATFFDFDRDGRLDLFLGNNVTFDQSGATVCESLTGARDYCGPGAYPFQGDRLFRNLGNGPDGIPRFGDVTAASGLAAAPSRPTLGAVAADFDGDGWQDLYVANDGQPNHLWRNLGDGRFEEVALLSGAALNASGAAEASMGVDAGDVDGDGDLDLFLAHLVKESNTLYRNDGRGGFTDATAVFGLAAPSLPFTAFGSAFLDFDNDGWLDLLVANGAVTLLPELVGIGDPFPLHQRNQLFRNLGLGTGKVPRFAEVSPKEMPALARSEVSRGLLVGDLDNDGDPDALVVNNGGPVRLLWNRIGQEHDWLGARLVTGSPPREALGAEVALLGPGGPLLRRWVRSDGSYSSAGDSRVLFGLEGIAPRAAGDTFHLLVRWPDGRRERFENVPMRRYSTLVQGTGLAEPEPASLADAAGLGS